MWSAGTGVIKGVISLISGEIIIEESLDLDPIELTYNKLQGFFLKNWDRWKCFENGFGCLKQILIGTYILHIWTYNTLHIHEESNSWNCIMVINIISW